MLQTDITIIGGGIVGAATALKLAQTFPNKKLHLIEKEGGPAKHQTGRNSGVIHAGVYYQPGSLKAQYCREGLQRTMQYCQQNGIAYHQCGKLLVATNQLEMERMTALFERCKLNELQPEMLSQAQLQEREPNVAGLGAFFVKDTGIVDYPALTSHFVHSFRELGGRITFGEEVKDLSETQQDVEIVTQQRTYHSDFLVNCAGVHADQLIRMMGIDVDFQILPFRGEYYLLPPKYNDIVKHLIYPIPDPDLPFLGVHLTKMINGTVTVGPNAVLAMGREAYEKFEVSPKDMFDMLRFSGTWKMLRSNVKSGINEMKNSLFKAGYLELVQKYCPKIELKDLLPYPSGIRAQAVSNNGELIHDFKFVNGQRSLHIGNAPSPAATSAMPIADAIVEQLSQRL